MATVTREQKMIKAPENKSLQVSPAGKRREQKISKRRKNMDKPEPQPAAAPADTTPPKLQDNIDRRTHLAAKAGRRLARGPAPQEAPKEAA